MLCTRCKKRMAVVFITAMQGEEKRNEGLCLVCARELGIPQVKEYMDQMGITDENVEDFCQQVEDLEEQFEMGGSETMPGFFQNFMMGGFPKSEDEDIDELGDVDEEFSSDSDSDNDPSGMFDLFKKMDRENARENKDKKAKKKKEKKLKYLTNYCTHLTQKARDGEIDRIIGRDKEISRVIQILSRRTKNNPCLIGEPGVGKTAIAEGIAQKIASGDVPFNIANKELYLLDLTALVAGTQFRGQFESRVKGLIDEVKAETNVILFIDEVHNLVGTGDSEGSMNAANILKPALSRGEVQVIGATTFKEYRKYIEKDSALERRFQPVTVNEPTIEDTVSVLCGIKEYYEKYHKVKVGDDIIRSCTVLSERYINDRFLPDKAIDLLDEACTRASINHPEIAEYEKKKSELEAKQKEITDIEDSNSPDYEKLSVAKAELMQLENEIKPLSETAENISVTNEDLSRVIELWTGIPANKIMESEFKKITGLEEALRSKIIGQDEAVSLVAKAIKRTRAQLSKRRRPASFIFVGSTGVGKTELVKVLASEMFDGVDPLIRLDMTEYMEKHSVSRIVGSPPGYVGYDEAGQLTEKVRRKPYSVILFDEIEKAHPDVMNILLQILDEGRITDAQGRNVNFENTVIVMTSNAGSSDKTSGLGFNKSENEISKEKAMKALNEFLRPEFIGRIDEIVVFSNLTIENFRSIAALMLDEMKEPLMEKKIVLSYDEKALEEIASKSYGGKFGARDIRNFIRKNVEDKVADIIVNDSVNVSKIMISANEKGVKVTSRK